MISPRILLLGAPGSGKSFYGRMITRTFGMPFFSMGDVLKERATKEEREQMEKGNLADPTLVGRVYKELCIDVADKGMVLDGYPRSQEQVDTLKQLIAEDERLRPDFALHFILRRDVIEAKLSGRRICPKCKSPYNVADVNSDGIVMPAILPAGGALTCCNVEMISRPDDRPEVVQHRLDSHFSRWNEMEDDIRSLVKVIDINLKGGADVTWPSLMRDTLTPLLTQHTSHDP
eukprot:TRINITY_DN779_c3_g1_i1.p1 TRINITY_DN779_c3_g1~~TRINITY_DN779_c3_g1_i1.p1  ORF type:complete len:232 (+),score=36.67 TRINITY_DN779_c3_g1_i1:42-737(+)